MTEGYTLNDILLTVYTIQIIVAPYEIKKKCYLLRSYLVDAGRMFLLMVEQVFLPMEEVSSMHNADTRGTVRERGGQRAEKNFYV